MCGGRAEWWESILDGSSTPILRKLMRFAPNMLEQFQCPICPSRHLHYCFTILKYLCYWEASTKEGPELQIPKPISTNICRQANNYVEGPLHYLEHLYFSMMCIATQPDRRQITETIPFLQNACLSCEVSLHDEVETANNYNISWKWILTKEGWKPPQTCKSVVPF